MEKKTKLAVGAIAAVSAIAVGAGVAVAGAGGEEALRGDVRDRATAAALDHVGRGTVSETEAADDGAGYEVEVRLPDGSQVEVRLDKGFNVVGSESDDDGAGEGSEGADDD